MTKTDFSSDFKNDVSAHRKIKQSTGEKIFSICNYIFFFLLAVAMIYPLWHQLTMSLSSVHKAAAGGLFFWPKEFTLATYKTVLRNPNIISGFRVSVLVTATGTLLGTFISAMLAYPLSKLKLRGGSIFMFAILFTMLFNGGMIPNYMLIRDLGMFDTHWAQILPPLCSAFNIIIMRNFFMSIPASLEESARIDGANDVYIFFRIIIPLSKATIATIALFTAVTYWNDFMSTIIYINTKTKWSMQAELRYLINSTIQALSTTGLEVTADTAVSENTIKAGSIVVTVMPILIVYPFLQKYFVKGVMVGSVKG